MRRISFFLLLSCLLGACSFSEKTVNVRYATFNLRYDNPGDSLNSWKYRKEATCKFIAENQLEIVGMQEVLCHQLEDLKQALPGYAAIGVGREDGKQAGEYAPLLYREDRFEVLDSNTFWLSQYPDSIGFIGWDGACTRIATWAKFKEKQSGRIFMAVNTHFDHVGTEARRKGALLIIDRIKEIVGDQPAILTGDFNVNNQSEAYRTLTTNAYPLYDSYCIAEEKAGVGYTFHGFGRIPVAEREKIDFIFVSKGIRVLKMDIPEEGQDGSGYLSDHNPVVAELEF